jgi:hypothetical protein
MTPSVVEIKQDEGDDFSTLSSSIGKKTMAIIGEKGSDRPSNVEDGGRMETSGEHRQKTAAWLLTKKKNPRRSIATTAAIAMEATG